MILLVDAFNAIYKFEELDELMFRGKLVPARLGFLEEMQQLRQNWKKPLELHLFFDGKKRPGDECYRETVNGIYIYYSHDLSADHLIKEFIKKSKNRGSLTVVSSDKEIIFFARGRKCQIKTSEEFSAWVRSVKAGGGKDFVPEKSSDIKLNEREVNYWLNIFKRK